MVSRRVVVGLILSLLLPLVAACGTTPTATAPTNPPAAATSAPAAATSAPAAATSAPATGGGTVDQGPCTAEAANSPLPSGKIRMVIGTGNTGGVFFPYGGGLAAVLTEKMPNTEATAEETGGSVDNMKLLHSEGADIGMSTVDSAYDAFKGQGAYTDTGPIAACTVAVLYQSYVHIVASRASGITSVEQMKGRRIGVGSAGSSTEGAADRVLEAAGLNPQVDVTRDNLNVTESAAALKDGKIDAFFWIGGIPTAAVRELFETDAESYIFIPASQYVESMVGKYGPVYTAYDLPAGTYKGQDEPVPGIGIGNIIAVRADMPEEQVYLIVKTMFDNLEQVQAIHPAARQLTLESAPRNSSIPFHPGAIRFYTEQGVWNP